MTTIAAELAQVADDELGRARLSLEHTALYLAAKVDERAPAALDLLAEQDAVLERITRAGLIPFPIDSDPEERRSYLEARIDRMRTIDPLLARFWDLHERRHEFLPTLN